MRRKNMKKTKAIVSVGLSAAIAFSAAGCGKKKTETAASKVEYTDGGYPIKCADKLTYWMDLDSSLSGSVENFGDTPLAKELEKETGIEVEYIHPQTGQAAEQFNIMLASDELPDMVTYDWLNVGGGPDASIKEEYIYKLNDAIDKWAPNLKKYLADNPDADKKVKTDEGSYYGFPFIRGEEWMTYPQGLILRKDWLDKIGMDEPKSLDELEAVLRAFRSKCGAKAPLVLTLSQIQQLIYPFGIDPEFYIDGGKVKYGAVTDEYKQALTKIKAWYDEGLLDNNLASADTKYNQARILNGDAGAYFGYVVSGMGAMLDAKPDDQPTFDLVACQQPSLNGETPEFSYKEDSVLTSYFVAIAKTCKNPELACRFLDYGFSDEGHKLFNFGIEGESYKMVDGKPKFTELITKNPDGKTFSQAAAMYSRGGYSGVFVHDPEYVRQSLVYPQQENAYEKWSVSNMDKHRMPPITLSSEEQEEYANIMNDINTYVAEVRVNMITGKQSINEFDSYLKQLKKYKIDRAVEIKQAAYDRYVKR